MTRRISDVRRAKPVDAQRIHIPHSSWTRTDRRKGPSALIAPDDFWARLGL